MFSMVVGQKCYFFIGKTNLLFFQYRAPASIFELTKTLKHLEMEDF
jgi:hypothetical protein